ncbi:MAG: tyrosine-type recombinase/integrase, partial [Candidatus Rokubacteria bacterium]|nr:tyrosine-type recombinase/integrase [Candidatus Rokubacteria bacterium]
MITPSIDGWFDAYNVGDGGLTIHPISTGRVTCTHSFGGSPPGEAKRPETLRQGPLTAGFYSKNSGGSARRPYLRAKNVRGVRSERLMRGRALAPAEIRALLRTCRRRRERPGGARDAAIVAILYAGGLRRSELVKLVLSDYEPKTGEIVVREAKG